MAFMPPSVARDVSLTANKKIALIGASASLAFTTPYNAHWTCNVVALANGTVKPMVDAGKKKWFFITTDYAFGHALKVLPLR